MRHCCFDITQIPCLHIVITQSRPRGWPTLRDAKALTRPAEREMFGDPRTQRPSAREFNLEGKGRTPVTLEIPNTAVRSPASRVTEPSPRPLPRGAAGSSSCREQYLNPSIALGKLSAGRRLRCSTGPPTCLHPTATLQEKKKSGSGEMERIAASHIAHAKRDRRVRVQRAFHYDGGRVLNKHLLFLREDAIMVFNISRTA